MPNLEIRGKTGTTQVVKKSVLKRSDKSNVSLLEHSWFVGYTSTGETPELAFAIVVEHGGSGGETAAPLLRQILSRYHDNGPNTVYQSGL